MSELMLLILLHCSILEISLAIAEHSKNESISLVAKAMDISFQPLDIFSHPFSLSNGEGCISNSMKIFGKLSPSLFSSG